MIKLVNKYLVLNNYLDIKTEFEELYSSHPNYPSVFAITDSLNMLTIENIAIQIPKEQLIELPDVFLAFFESDLVLVIKNENSIVIENEKGTKTTLGIDCFSKGWNGIILAVEPNQALEKEVKVDTKWIAYSIPIVILILLSIFYNNYSLSNFLFLCTSIVGLVISISIVREKFGLENEIVSKICNINPKTSCDSVIKSEKSQINKWMNFTDLSLLFFTINTLSILLNPITSSKIIGLFSIVSCPVIIYSIWLQKFRIKKWCILCLLVSVLLILQGIVGFFEQSLMGKTIFNDFSYLFFVMIITPVWLIIKPIIENKIKTEVEVNELKKFKRSYPVFRFLLKSIPVWKGFNKLKGLQFGNQNSNIAITIILSPSCGYCHKIFEEAIDLIHKYPEKIFLNVLFNINPDNSENVYRDIVENLLAINNLFPEKIEEAICDWYIRKMKLNKWLNKWKVDLISIEVNQQVKKQYDWCLLNELNYTPIKIVNGKLFPNEYTISELRYFLNEISEDEVSIVNESVVEL